MTGGQSGFANVAMRASHEAALRRQPHLWTVLKLALALLPGFGAYLAEFLPQLWHDPGGQ